MIPERVKPRIKWDMEGGYPWADEFDLDIKNKIVQQNHMNVMDFRRIGKASDLAFFTTEHFDPLLYVLGASREDDELTIFNETRWMGSMSMTEYRFD